MASVAWYSFCGHQRQLVSAIQSTDIAGELSVLQRVNINVPVRTAEHLLQARYGIYEDSAGNRILRTEMYSLRKQCIEPD